jgi:hypothetical protein
MRFEVVNGYDLHIMVEDVRELVGLVPEEKRADLTGGVELARWRNLPPEGIKLCARLSSLPEENLPGVGYLRVVDKTKDPQGIDVRFLPEDADLTEVKKILVDINPEAIRNLSYNGLTAAVYQCDNAVRIRFGASTL